MLKRFLTSCIFAMACVVVVVVVVCVAVVAGSLPVARRQSLVACCQFNHAKEHGRSNATNELPHTQLNSNSRGNSNIDNNNTQGYFINVIAAMLRWSASTRLCGNCSIILKLITCQDSRAPRRTTTATATYNNNDKAVADDNRIVVWGPDSFGQAGAGRARPFGAARAASRR